MSKLRTAKDAPGVPAAAAFTQPDIDSTPKEDSFLVAGEEADYHARMKDASSVALAGKYAVWHNGAYQNGITMVINSDNAVTFYNNQVVFLAGVLHAGGNVKAKCDQAPDASATMYMDFGDHYDCLSRDGVSLVGNVYVESGAWNG